MIEAICLILLGCIVALFAKMTHIFMKAIYFSHREDQILAEKGLLGLADRKAYDKLKE